MTPQASAKHLGGRTKIKKCLRPSHSSSFKLRFHVKLSILIESSITKCGECDRVDLLANNLMKMQNMIEIAHEPRNKNVICYDEKMLFCDYVQIRDL